MEKAAGTNKHSGGLWQSSHGAECHRPAAPCLIKNTAPVLLSAAKRLLFQATLGAGRPGLGRSYGQAAVMVTGSIGTGHGSLK